MLQLKLIEDFIIPEMFSLRPTFLYQGDIMFALNLIRAELVSYVGLGRMKAPNNLSSVCIHDGLDDIKMWAAEIWVTAYESNICFCHMNFTCSKSQAKS